MFEDEVSKESAYKFNYLGKLVDLWMKQKEHDRPLRITDLQKLKVKYKSAPKEIIDLTKSLIGECLNELKTENKRFVIQTSKIEDNKYYGGYYHS